MKANSPLRAVGYVRVSTEEQLDNRSLSAQRREIKRFCESKGYSLASVYSDEGVSAHGDEIAKRPQLQALLLDAELRQFDIVVVHTIDRFARNVGVQRQALAILGRCDVGFASCTEDFDFVSPSGKLLLTMMGGISEFFSDQLAVHIRKGQRERAVSGLPVGPVPFGYLVHDPGSAPSVVSNEAEAVRTLFERRLAGDSLAQLASWLNDSGFSTRKGRRFSPHSVKDMLACRFYLGVIALKGEEFPSLHERIVSDSLFERVAIRRMRRQSSPRRSRGAAIGSLRRLIACAKCGRPIHGERNHYGYAMYRERHGQMCETDGRSVTANKIDRQIGEIFRSIELPRTWRDRMASLAVKSKPLCSPKALQSRKRRIGIAFVDGTLTKEDYDRELSGIDELLRAAETPEDADAETAAHLFSNLRLLWDKATADERQRMLSGLLDRVYLDIDTKRIKGIAPAPAFMPLIANAVRQASDAKCVIVPVDAIPDNGDWSAWWRRGRVELGDEH